MVAQVLKRRTSMSWKNELPTAAHFLFLMTALVVLVSSVALAGTDQTFAQADSFVTNFLSGTGGKTIAGVSLISAVVNAVTRFNWTFFGSAVAVGLACGIGPNIMQTFYTGVF